MEKTRQDTDNKAKVDKAIIIVSGTKEEPYCLTNVFNWKDQYLDIVSDKGDK